MVNRTPKNIGEYIKGFPQDTQKLLEQIRDAIKAIAPQSEETISYGMPTFKLNGRYLIYFAGYKKHIGLYPVPINNKLFEKAFSSYKTSGRGAIQFPFDRPIPINLIKRIVKFRLKESLRTTHNKKK